MSSRLAGLCGLAVRKVAIDGAAVVIVSPSGERRLLAQVGVLSTDLEQVTAVLAEGPVAESKALAVAAVIDDLDTEKNWSRWPVFVGEALRLGISALFALPMRIASINLGVFVGYRLTPGPLTEGELDQLLQIANTAAQVALGFELDGLDDAQAGGDHGAEEAWIAQQVEDLVAIEIHQASGMIMVQLGIPIEAALSRLRAYAFAHDRPLADVARDVVARRVNLER